MQQPQEEHLQAQGQGDPRRVIWQDVQMEQDPQPVQPPLDHPQRPRVVHPVMRGVVTPYDSAWVSRHAEGPFATTDILREAAHVLVTDGEQHVGYMWALGTQTVQSIIDEFIQDNMLETPIQTTPIEAMRWDEVARVQLHGQARVRAEVAIDTRATRWELYQRHRELPLLLDGQQFLM